VRRFFLLLILPTILALSSILLVTTKVFAVSVSIEPQTVDESTRIVKISFTNLVNKKYFVCLNNEDNCRSLSSDVKDYYSIDAKDIINNTYTVSVCGDGKTKLKIDKNDKNCKETRDFFHGGQTYRLRLFEKEFYSPTQLGNPVSGAQATFNVGYFFPIPNVIALKPDVTETSSPTFNDSIRVRISGTRPGGDVRNNYAVQLYSVINGQEKEITSVSPKCTVVKDNNTPGEVIFPPQQEGTYRIYLADQKDEGGYLNTGIGGGCNAGVKLSGSQNGKEIIIAALGGSLGTIVNDPTGDIAEKAAIALLDAEGAEVEKAPPNAPCAKYDGVKCVEVTTAIGNISTEPAGFVETAFSLVLGVAGGIAVILIIISGYRIMESRGNEERLQAAREQLTSAIVGLLFIIFSFVILQVIGVNIRRIPGFEP